MFSGDRGKFVDWIRAAESYSNTSKLSIEEMRTVLLTTTTGHINEALGGLLPNSSWMEIKKFMTECFSLTPTPSATAA